MRASNLFFAALASAIAFAAAQPANAGPAWDSIRAEVYAGKILKSGAGHINLRAPYRPDDNMSVPL